MFSDSISENKIRQENQLLKAENKRLQDKINGDKAPLSDEAIDGIAITLLILIIVAGVSFWLAVMPS